MFVGNLESLLNLPCRFFSDLMVACIIRLKQRKDSVDFQRMNRIEGLKSRLQVNHLIRAMQ